MAMLLIVASFLILACKEEEPQTGQYDIRGYVQKGPFIIGTPVDILELSRDLRQTGKMFTTEILGTSGSFEVNDVDLVSSYVQLSASGFYFDEVKGDVSAATLTLNAVSDITDVSHVNVNVLTHLEKRRVEYLLGESNSFSTAKSTAQAEILAAFGISLAEIDNSELLDLTSADDGGGILLAISVILQGERSVGELAEVLAVISDDMRPDGSLDNEDLLNSLRASAKGLEPAAIRANLSNRYQYLAMTAAVPDFEEYINAFLSLTGQAPISATLAATNIHTLTATLNGVANANSLSTTVAFEYGTTHDYGNKIVATANPLAGHVDVSVSADLAGLSPGTTYHFRIVSENAEGVVYGDDMSFTTLGQAPVAVTHKATDLKPTQVVVHGSVNPHHLATIVTFEYGTTMDFTSSVTAMQSPLSGNTSTKVSATISGLSMGQTYYFRIKAENELGTVVGDDFSVVPFHPIGSAFEGGLLAYVLQPGDTGHDPSVGHGLIVAPDDIQYNDTYPHLDDFATIWTGSTGEWYQDVQTGASGIDLGDGKANTDLIVGTYGNGYYAAITCYELVLNGYDDWFLPSLGELEKLRENHAKLRLYYGGMHGHWSSSERSGWEAWVFKYIDSQTGTAGYINKTSYAKVRPMRYF